MTRSNPCGVVTGQRKSIGLHSDSHAAEFSREVLVEDRRLPPSAFESGSADTATSDRSTMVANSSTVAVHIAG